MAYFQYTMKNCRMRSQRYIKVTPRCLLVLFCKRETTLIQKGSHRVLYSSQISMFIELFNDPVRQWRNRFTQWDNNDLGNQINQGWVLF